MVAYKHEKNMKELLTRADPYNIINNVDDEMHTKQMKEAIRLMYKLCDRKK